MFASITHVSSDYCTTKIDSEGNQAPLSGFQGLILSKTFESHSNPVPGVISSLQMKMQIQLAYILPNSMYAVSRLLAPALRKCLWNKKYQAQRFSWKSVAILWTATSASLTISTSLIALQIQRKQRKGKNTQKNTDIDTAKISFFLFPKIIKYQTQKHALAILTNI